MNKSIRTHNIIFLTNHHNKAIITNSTNPSHFKININSNMHKIFTRYW